MLDDLKIILGYLMNLSPAWNTRDPERGREGKVPWQAGRPWQTGISVNFQTCLAEDPEGTWVSPGLIAQLSRPREKKRWMLGVPGSY